MCFLQCHQPGANGVIVPPPLASAAPSGILKDSPSSQIIMSYTSSRVCSTTIKLKNYNNNQMLILLPHNSFLCPPCSRVPLHVHLAQGTLKSTDTETTTVSFPKF